MHKTAGKKRVKGNKPQCGIRVLDNASHYIYIPVSKIVAKLSKK